MQKLQTIEQFGQLQKEDGVIFMFTADWCGDCRFIEPALPAIEEKYEHLSFYSVDRDEFIDLCGELDILGIPSFVAYDKGEEIGRFVSKDRKTQAEIETFIDQLNFSK